MSRPYVPESTSKRFYVPTTLAADFTEFLNTDIPNTVMDFTLLPDWYDQFKEGYEPRVIRGEIYPDSTKSRYSNTDNNLNFRADVNSGIKKGDMIIDPKGMAYVLDWEVALQSNNAPSRAVRCNMFLTVERFFEDEVDDLGYLISERGYRALFEKQPANAYRYDGRPEYSAVSGTPGVSPGALTIVTVQYNDYTKNIRADDRFTWGNEVYEIVDVNRVGVNEINESGTLTLQAKKAAGGIL